VTGPGESKVLDAVTRAADSLLMASRALEVLARDVTATAGSEWWVSASAVAQEAVEDAARSCRRLAGVVSASGKFSPGVAEAHLSWSGYLLQEADRVHRLRDEAR